MGFYDTVTFETAHEACGIAAGARYETKSLGRGSDEYMISGTGELVLEQCRYEDADQSSDGGFPRLKRVVIGDVVVPYHGDLLLTGVTDQEPNELAARFTHGKLEWVRPVASYPERWVQLLIDIGTG